MKKERNFCLYGEGGPGEGGRKKEKKEFMDECKAIIYFCVVVCCCEEVSSVSANVDFGQC